MNLSACPAIRQFRRGWGVGEMRRTLVAVDSAARAVRVVSLLLGAVRELADGSEERDHVLSFPGCGMY